MKEILDCLLSIHVLLPDHLGCLACYFFGGGMDFHYSFILTAEYALTYKVRICRQRGLTCFSEL